MSEAKALDSEKRFSNYWKRKKSLQANAPHFSVKQWARGASISEIEKIYFAELMSSPKILDVGAGDMWFQKKLIDHGYNGTYHTQDVGHEFTYTYRNLDEVKTQYDAIICMDVIEHMPLIEGLNLIEKMISLLSHKGILIIQTPNARCIRNPMAWDMTHLHCYNLPDLWAYLSAEGFEVNGYRIVFSESKSALSQIFASTLSWFSRLIITRLMGADYADNIAVIARKQKSQIKIV